MSRKRPWVRPQRRQTNPVFRDTLPDPLQRRACYGKEMLNKEQARQAVARMKKELDTGDRLNFYKCLVCGRYHVGNNARWMEQ